MTDLTESIRPAAIGRAGLRASVSRGTAGRGRAGRATSPSVVLAIVLTGQLMAVTDGM
jgi:hypothetical protein